jgi:glycerophosphoryl diester phosphodiesterase
VVQKPPREARPVPRIIGHRGAPGYRPEHTPASYRLAIAMGVDAVEPDLVMTADGVVIVRHEPELSETTDIATRPEFADRQTTKQIDGRPVTGWFAEDLTLAEIRMLRAVERLADLRHRNTRWDRAAEVMTFDELLLLVAGESRRAGRRVAVHAELKSPSRLAGLGLDLESAVLGALQDHSMGRQDSGVHLQSFEPSCLRRLRERTDLTLVQLVEASGAPADVAADGDPTTYDDLVTPAGLRAVAHYADAIGLAKSRLLGAPEAAAGLVDEAHLNGLRVFVWTLRDENRFLAPQHRIGDAPGRRGDSASELFALLDAGVDGVFCDHPDTALAARERWRLGAALARG